MKAFTKKELAALLDQTLLKADVTSARFESFCATARDYGFASVAVNGANVPTAKKLLAGSGVLVDAACAFPLGQVSLDVKKYEAESLIRSGADEVDYVLNIGRLKDGDYAYIEKEMREITAICHEHGAICKVIFENCYLTDAEKIAASKIAAQARPDFIKTSTGFGTGGATLADVRLMKENAGPGIKVKAAGGIRTLTDTLAFLDAGVERIGTSCGDKIVDEL